MKKVLRYFDKLEDRIRGRLSRYPIAYSIIGGTCIVLFWRGVWITADNIAALFPSEYIWLDGILSIAISTTVLLVTGLFVSFVVNDTIILSGLKQEKKLVEKNEEELKQESKELRAIEKHMTHLEDEFEDLYKHLVK